MNPSDLSHYGNDPISYSDQAFSCTPFSIESNPTSKQGTNNCALPPPPPPSPPPLSFSQFPSPFEDNDIFHDFSVHHHQYLVAHEPLVNNSIEVSIKNKIIPMPRKRSCKRDRHSKINTARGLRDRRMRLSLEVAKRFFGLQDMLGFEKASKTVEWLLNQAKVEIKQLAREKNLNPSCASSTSECTEGISSLEEVVISGNQEQPHNKKVKRSKTKGSNSRKSAFDPLVARESREKARERARERTKEKMRSRKLLASDESKSNQCKEGRITTNHNDNLNKLGTWNPFETVEESAGTHSQIKNPSLDVVTEAEERSSQAKENLGTVEDMGHDDDDDSLGIMSKWSIILNSLNNSVIVQEHQYAGFQSLGKPCWEAYNYHM